ncbi:MAG: hydroxymethylbilane synthase [Pseudobdellovibrionaceae bacterium]
MAHILRIGTRGSLLAKTQTGMVADALRKTHPDLQVEIIEILTSGDWKPQHGETRLMEAKGGKGQFAHEIEQRILSGEIDCGVHSLKDMPSFLPEGLQIDHFLPREDPRDVFVSFKYKSIDDLPIGAVVGTSSLRRQAFLLLRRPDLKIVPLRGNVPTRLEKLSQEQVDATFLALAGLKRLSLLGEGMNILAEDEFLPACGQGIIGIETREGDTKTAAFFDALNCARTACEATAERAVLQVLDGSCHTPVGAFAQLQDGVMQVRVQVAFPDGSASFADHQSGPVNILDEARLLGQVLGHRIKARLPEGIL